MRGLVLACFAVRRGSGSRDLRRFLGKIDGLLVPYATLAVAASPCEFNAGRYLLNKRTDCLFEESIAGTQRTGP